MTALCHVYSFGRLHCPTVIVRALDIGIASSSRASSRDASSGGPRLYTISSTQHARQGTTRHVFYVMRQVG